MAVTQADGQVRYAKGTPWGLKLFGLAWAAVPGFMAVMMLVDVARGGDQTLLYILPFPGLFLLMSLGFIAGRWGVTVDFKQNRVRKWRGIGPLVFGGWRDFGGQLSSVHVQYRERTVSTKNGSRTVREWPVELRGTELDPALLCPDDYLDARCFGEAAARCGRCELVDSGFGEEHRRGHEELDVPLARRLQDLPELPAAALAGSQFTAEDDGKTLQLQVPPALFNPLIIAAPVGGLIFSGIVLIGFWDEIFGPEADPVFRFIAAGFAVSPLILASVVAVVLLRRSLVPERLSVGREGLLWRRGKQRRAIPLEELEELVLVQGDRRPGGELGGLAAISDKRLIPFAAGLELEERRRCYQLMLRRLQQLGTG